MASQYAKRKAKEKETADDNQAELITAEVTDAPVLTHTAYDIYQPADGRSHKLVTIKYNPETGDAQVVGTGEISRLVALSHERQKAALETLKSVQGA